MISTSASTQRVDPQRGAATVCIAGFTCTYVQHGGEYLQIRDCPGGRCCHLILQLNGGARWTQAGRSATLACGDMLLLQLAFAASVALDAAATYLCVHIPRESLDARGSHGELRLAQPVTGAPAALLGSLIRSAFEHAGSLDALHLEAFREALLRLVAAIWGAATLPPCGDSPCIAEPAFIRRAKAYVLEHLSDPTVSPAKVADAQGLSVRHLHRLFAATGSSFSAFVRQNRLARCAADLRDASLAGERLTRIAFRWGFNDSAHFSRVFLAEYGATPRDYRHQQLALVSLSSLRVRSRRRDHRAGGRSWP